MGVVAACLLTAAALACFALAMAKHHRQVFGRAPSPSRVRRLRIVGAVLLVVAPAPWIAQQGPTMALVAWLFCGTPLAGLAVVALFSALDARR